MKIHILSDLHIEFEPFVLPESAADIILLAGDTSVGTRGVEWALKKNFHKPVIYVAGNHEFYRNAYPKLLNDLAEETKNTNVHFLENQSLTIGDLRILACTLWTDFSVYGTREYSMMNAGLAMNDYKLIRRSPQFSRLKSLDTALIFAKSFSWLKKELSAKVGKTLVVIHHAPSIRSVPPVFYGNEINPAFCSNLEELIMEFQPEMWVHGHIHTACDYLIGNTRVICNPKGYPSELNCGFNPHLVVEI